MKKYQLDKITLGCTLAIMMLLVVAIYVYNKQFASIPLLCIALIFGYLLIREIKKVKKIIK